MGYVREKKIYKLTWADGEFAGLEVRAKSVQTGELLDLMKLSVQVRGTKDAEGGVAVVEQLLTGFADKALVSWNLEERLDDDDPDSEVRPVPATLAGLKSQDLGLVMHVIETWIETVSGTPGDLGKDSPNGGPYPEGSLATEASLANLSNSLTPG